MRTKLGIWSIVLVLMGCHSKSKFTKTVSPNDNQEFKITEVIYSESKGRKDTLSCVNYDFNDRSKTVFFVRPDLEIGIILHGGLKDSHNYFDLTYVTLSKDAIGKIMYSWNADYFEMCSFKGEPGNTRIQRSFQSLFASGWRSVIPLSLSSEDVISGVVEIFEKKYSGKIHYQLTICDDEGKTVLSKH